MLEISFERAHELTNAIRNYLAKNGVDFELVTLTKSEVIRLVAAFFSKVNKIKLTERQIGLFDDLRERAAQETKKEEKKRRKNAHYKRFNKAKSLRTFLRDQNVLFVVSSNNKSEFIEIKRVHQAYLEDKPYTKAQKRFLEILRQKTRDLSNNFNNSQSKKKPGLILTKNLQEVECKMVEKNKDQERFSKEKYEQNYKKWLPEKEYDRNLQREVQEARKEISLDIKKILHYLDIREKDCVRCNYRGTYMAPIEASLAEYEGGNEEEKDFDELPVQSGETQEVSYKEIKDQTRIKAEVNAAELKEIKNPQKEKSSKATVSSDSKLPLKKIELRTVSKKTIIDSSSKISKKKTQKRIMKQKKKKKAVMTHLSRFNSLESSKKERAAIKGEYKKFSRMLRSATVKLYECSNGPISTVDDSQIKQKIFELNKSFPLNPDKIPLPYHDLKSRIEHDDKLINKFF